MHTPRSSSCPFVAGPKITDPALFVGRKEELRFLAGRMNGSQPVSVNVVGERLSGTSSLLWHFTDMWAQMGPDPGRFLVVFICLRLAKPRTEAEFYRTLAKALHDKLPDVPVVSSSNAFKEKILDKLAERRLLPVFCLDEFEKLFDHKDELKKDFYDGLHSLTNTNRMMLIIATRRPVEIIAGEHQLLSAFFNFGQLCELKDFRDEEAEELLRLPVSGPPVLDLEERQQARRWGGRSPWQLQLAALFLFEARQNGKSLSWAKKAFERERARRLKKETKPRSFKALLDSGFSILKQMAEAAVDIGKILLLLILLALLAGIIYGVSTGKLTWSAAGDLLLKLIGK
jgi:hypothetical protein